MYRSVLMGIIFLAVIAQSAFGQNNPAMPEWGNWQHWGDAGDGTYCNPVLPADYSDIDCIRVRSDYYAVSSTFQYSPGFVILHSKDLVNWHIIGHVVNDITRISPQMNWDKMDRYGKGIWAGAIRYHNKKFWVYFGTPDEGYFMSTATNPAGPWQPVQHVLAQKGWDDCSPFWDDDGQGYLVGTHFSDGYKIHLFKLSVDGKKLILKSDKVIHQSDGSEANKLYKINGTYYHFFSEVKPGGRAVMMERAKNVYGPYSEVKQLSYAQPQFNEPNQGGIVQTEKGAWYFLTHHGTGDWSGRVVSLLPVTWLNGWPVIGKPDSAGIGRMVWAGKMPAKSAKNNSIKTSDEFNSARLAEQWEWNYQPRAGKWSLTERRGWLRLKSFKPLRANDLSAAGNTLTQHTMRTVANEVVVKLDISGIANGQHAGLSHFGVPDYSAVGIVVQRGKKELEFNVKGAVKEVIPFTGDTIWLKSTWGLDGKSRYYYSLNGIDYTAFGDFYQMEWGSYRGDRIAIYSYNNVADAGYVDVDYFHYTY